MASTADLLLTYIGIAAFLLVFGYLVPAGLTHWLVTRNAAFVGNKLQSRVPSAADIRREVSHSLTSIALFALYCVALFELYLRGGTAIDWSWNGAAALWAPVSFVIAMIAHDSYFYWTHRLMHHPALYRHFHAGHHRSIAPTAWAILSFQPLETLFQFAFFALLICLVPLHPFVLFAYFMFDGMVNALGHCGHEVVPAKIRNHPILKYMNAVRHHDLHHSRFRYNFGQYFNVWDRLMGTYLDGDEQAARARRSQQG